MTSQIARYLMLSPRWYSELEKYVSSLAVKILVGNKVDKIDTLLPFIHTLLNPVEMNSSNCDTCYATMKGSALYRLNGTIREVEITSLYQDKQCYSD